MKLRELLRDGYSILKESGIESYHIDTQIILGGALNKERLYVLTNPEADIPECQIKIYYENLCQRSKGCPLQYIINECEFYSMDFYVDEAVLIPRADTEVLVDAAIKRIGESGAKVIEIGTGSGIIAVSVAKHCKNARITATDISREALLTAKKNAALNNADINFRLGDVYSALEAADYPADYIISNPPYIETAVIETLETSVKDYEPYRALDGGTDGLYFYRSIIGGAGKYLSPGGAVLFEIGYNQGSAVEKILTDCGFTDITITKDSAGHDRVIEASMCPSPKK